MSREQVLSLLLDQHGTYLSGETMSHTLGISRAAIWKAIEALRQEGYVIQSAPHRGYLLTSAPNRIRVGELTKPLSHCHIGRQLICLDQVDSTNTEAKRQALAGAPHGLVILSEEQTGGRGRLGRTFHSPRGLGLYLTALLRPLLPPDQVVDFTAWVAVAVCHGIQSACGIRPQIKWTNDLVWEGRKLCGILTELGLEHESNTLDYLICGIGVNVNQQEEDFQEELRPVALSLAQILGHPLRRAQLAIHIIQALDRMYQEFPHQKQSYLEQYRQDCITPGHPVQLVTPNGRKDAFALAIDDQFRLVVDYGDGVHHSLSAGEVSVRGMYGYV